MKIVTIPHPSLRQVAEPITQVTPELTVFLDGLQQTLAKTKNPKGVGLAAPQVNRGWRVFATALSDNRASNRHEAKKNSPPLRVYLNPVIIDHSDKLSMGPKKDEAVLEGCLSIPGIYGPVPRWPSVMLQYDEVVGNELRQKTDEFHDFAARVIQHELDHLNGVLFIDYALEFSTPLYQDNPKQEKLEELPMEFIPAFVEKSKV